MPPLSFLIALATGYHTCRAADDSSLFDARPPDPAALDAAAFGAVGDGVTDDTRALQAALDATFGPTTAPLDAPGSRTVLVAGDGHTYRLSATLWLPTWARIVGYGKSRPALLLPPGTPGFGNATHLTPLVAVVDCKRNCSAQPARDGGNTAFGVGLVNIDVNIGAGNPGAVGVRNRAAQGGTLRSMRFTLAADAAAGVHSPGWAQQDLTFIGGRVGVLVYDTGAWPSSFRDCVFHAQGVGGVAWDAVSGDANPTSPWEGITLVRANFSSAPAAVDMSAVRVTARVTILESTFAQLDRAVVVPPPLLSAGGTSVLVRDSGGAACPVLFAASDAAPAVLSPGGGSGAFSITALTAGAISLDALAPGGDVPTVHVDATVAAASEPPPVPPRDTPGVPPVATWRRVTDAGLVGDGVTDNAAALAALLASAPSGAALFFPAGVYLTSRGLRFAGGRGLRLLGLHCWDVVISLSDGAPGFADPAAPEPLLHVTAGGGGLASWITGLNLRSGVTFGAPQPPPVPPGWFNPNPGAIALLWAAPIGGVQDLYFHPASFPDNARLGTGPNTEQSLVVTSGGGGVFADVWSCNAYSVSGAVVLDTDADVRFYQLSSEHHAGRELWIANASRVRVHGMQTEDRSPDAAPTAAVVVERGGAVDVTGLFAYYAANASSAGAVVVDASSTASVGAFRQYHSYHPMFYNCSIAAEAGVCVNATDFALVVVRPAAA